jgi:hypothetical protein
MAQACPRECRGSRIGYRGMSIGPTS